MKKNPTELEFEESPHSNFYNRIMMCFVKNPQNKKRRFIGEIKWTIEFIGIPGYGSTEWGKHRILTMEFHPAKKDRDSPAKTLVIEGLLDGSGPYSYEMMVEEAAIALIRTTSYY